MAEMSFAVYQSTQPQLPVRFEYPADWEVEDSRGTQEAYTQVQVYGPASLDDRLRTYLSVRAIPPHVEGGRYASLAEMIESYEQTVMPTFRIDQRQQIDLLGVTATQLDLSGTLSLPWEPARSTPVPVKSQRLFFEKDGRLYELSWMATPEAAPTAQAAFARLLQTLTLTP